MLNFKSLSLPQSVKSSDKSPVCTKCAEIMKTQIPLDLMIPSQKLQDLHHNLQTSGNMKAE